MCDHSHMRSAFLSSSSTLNTCVDAACLADAACSLGCIQLSTVLFVGSLIFKLNDQVKLYEALQPGKVVFVFGRWRGEGGRGGVEGGG